MQKTERSTWHHYCPEALLTLAVCAACAVALTFLRGMWLDEAWTIWFTDPGLPFAVAYDRWLHDAAHPHLYLFVQWLLSPLTETSLAARRLTHLPLLLALVIPTVLLVRRNTSPDYLLLVAVAFATNPFFITYFAEHRPYNIALISVGCLALLIRFVHVEAAAQRPVSWAAYAWLFLMALFALNIHYTVAMTAATLLGCSVLTELYLRRIRLVLMLLAILMIALVAASLQLFAAVQVGAPTSPAYFTVQKGMLYIAVMLLAGLVANPALAWFAAWGSREEFRRGIGVLPREPGSRSFVIILIGTLIVCALGFAVLHLITRSVAPRLLIGLLAPSIILLVELATWRSLGRGQFRLICLSGALLVLATMVHQANNRRWEHHLPRIKQIVMECPTTRVFAVPRRFREGIGEQEAQVHPFVYRLLGRKGGFDVEVPPQQTSLSIRDISCPVLLWREHEFLPDRTAAEWLAYARVEADPRQIAATEVLRAESHILVVVPPLSAIND